MPPSDQQDHDALRPVQRTAAYAVVVDPAGRVLLVRASTRSDLRGRWFLPGGGLRHGEHPRDGVLRELAEETGLTATLASPRDATADVIDLPHRGVSIHTLRLIYDVQLPDVGVDPGATLRAEPDGTSDLVRFVSLDEASGLPLMPFVADLLGLPAPARLQPSPPDRPEPLGLAGEPDQGELEPSEPEPRDGASEPTDEASGPADGVSEQTDEASAPGGRASARSAVRGGLDDPVFVQRPAAYAVLIDETVSDDEAAGNGAAAGNGEPAAGAGKMLLTRLVGSNGTWTLPGGGIDHGEHPLVALERELYEETGLPYTAGPLLDIGSRHFIGRAPNGQLENFHGLRLIYAGSVPVDRPPQVIEVDGSTDLAAWVPLPELNRIGAAPTVREALGIWTEHRARQSPSR